MNNTEFQKVRLSNGTLSWNNILITLPHENGSENKYPYEIDPLVLYQNSRIDTDKQTHLYLEMVH